MIYEDFKNIKTDRMVKAVIGVIGVSREKFDSLVLCFSVAYRTIQEVRYQDKEIKEFLLVARMAF